MFRHSSLLPLVSGLLPFASGARRIAVGEPAPEFRLLDQHRTIHHLSQYRGRWLVLYFYPKDDTPGCRTEACGFQQDLGRLRGMGVELLGISTDAVSSHLQFADKFHLSFPLLADETGEVAASYGSLFKLGPLKFAKRHTFIVDPEGKVAAMFRKVDPDLHSDEVVEALLGLDDSMANQPPPG
ncbi:MAG: peroxiredoxin [Candidatus Thiodiazotropha sp.]